MRRKILLAEQSEATRRVADTILRQQGFEVVAVADGAAAVDFISNGRPDLVLVGCELSYRDQPVYQLAQQMITGDDRPILVFTNIGKTIDGVPPELTIPRPFDPRDFLEKVTAAIGRHVGARPAADIDTPLGSVDDDLLDAALGLGTTGSIRVTESEVMNGTRKLRTPSSGHDDDLDRTGRIESIVIADDQTDIRLPDTTKVKRPAAEAPDTGNLDILGDQYGLSDPAAFRQQQSAEDLTHDYHWFVSEMQKEADHSPTGPAQSGRAAAGNSPDELVFTEPSSTLEPFNPKGHIDPPAQKKDTGGVEKFIDEFKREVEKFHADEPESLTVHEEPPKPADNAKWEEMVESITPERVTLFTRQLASELAERIAEKIVDKLDSDKLAGLIKAEILAQLRTKKNL